MFGTDRSRVRRRARRLTLALAAAAVLGLSGAAPALVSSAAAGSSSAATFAYTGDEQQYTVPAGATAVTITAVGAPGGVGPGGVANHAMGALVTATVPLSPGTTTLYVEVGGAGAGEAVCGITNGPAFNGGGASDCGGGGGGASDVRATSVSTVPNSGLTAANDSRLVVAGGGGGSGAGWRFGCGAGGGAAGDQAASGAGGGGAGSDDCPGATAGGNSGSGGTQGGSGGLGSATHPQTGDPGSLGVGGDAPAPADPTEVNGGAGGGGGYWGGGGGGDGHVLLGGGGGGGGAGSSFWADGATGTSMAEDTTGTASVAITPVFPWGFELDGNALQDSAGPTPYDWSNLFDSSGNRVMAQDFNPLAASAFKADTYNSTTDDIFTGGGSKDALGIQSGPSLYTNAKPQPKDDLEHVFAGMLIVPHGELAAGHRVLVAGADRFDDSSDSTLGLWLLQDPFFDKSTSGSFIGVHHDGDLFFVMDFTVGGSTSAVTVYRWTGDDATGSLTGPLVLPSAGCASAPIGSNLRCAKVNGSQIDVPWSYIDKTGATSPRPGEFAEMGVDLTGVLGAANVPCFSSILAETRSSQSPTATLLDFAIAKPLVTCDTPAITTNADPGGSSVLPGAPQQDDASVTAPDTSTPVSGTLTFFLCGPGASTAGGCPKGAGTQVGDPVTIAADGTATSAQVSGSDTSAGGRYCWRAEYTPDAAARNSHLPNSETNGTSECFTVVIPDTTPPDITVTVDPADQLAGSGWYNIASSGTDGVLVHVSATDQTAVTNITCDDGSSEVLSTPSASGSFTLTDGKHSISCTASDGINPPGAGPASTTMPIEIDVDQTAPGLSPSVSPSPLYLHATGATASAGATDATSGVATSGCGAIDTSSAGDHTVSCTATDNAGNPASATIHYTVQYRILGWFSPAPKSQWKTGQTVPIKIALADVNGVRIPDAEAAGLLSPTCYVKVSANGAQTLTPTCMKYDPINHQFIYNWKLGSKTGSEMIAATVSYAGTTATTSLQPDPITITK
jgi:hypothetical protein